MYLATIPAAGIITLVGVALAVLFIAAYLIAIAVVLRKVSAGLNVVISAVAQIPGRTEPLEPVLTSINHDLGTARGVLEGLLTKKLGALPKPPGVIKYGRTGEQPAALAAPPPEPAAVVAESPERIVYQRAPAPARAEGSAQSSPSAPPEPVGVSASDGPKPIVWRRAGER